MTVRINKGFVRAVLGARNMSLRDLADASDIGEATLYRIVNGAKFNSTTLEKLADALDCNPVDLLDVSGYPDPHMVAPTA